MTASWFTPAPPRVIAHRGLATEAPENTLPAFLAALALGVTHLETDVHATSDGVAVLSHDADLGRIGGPATGILGLTSREVARLRLPDGTEVPSLDDALSAFPDARFNIDIKVDEAVEPTVAAIKRHRAAPRVLVTSFDDARRKAAVAALPGVATSPSTRGVVRAAVAARTPLPWFRRRALQGIDALQIPEKHRGVQVLSAALLEAAHSAGVEVHVWTVNDPVDMARLLDRGVDGLITDRSDLALALLRTRSSK
ncbi:glycerophosphodiester phosphodiesterase family protein [Frondihabitans sp. 4ASC-45]|uniref:glycerophosphodiester phosphodiesterase family protein n=1 Tax=Frondihabitans sp. 4ASC-45 TaxID=3111636 RepID=UPI003C240416